MDIVDDIFLRIAVVNNTACRRRHTWILGMTLHVARVDVVDVGHPSVLHLVAVAIVESKSRTHNSLCPALGSGRGRSGRCVLCRSLHFPPAGLQAGLLSHLLLGKFPQAPANTCIPASLVPIQVSGGNILAA